MKKMFVRNYENLNELLRGRDNAQIENKPYMPLIVEKLEGTNQISMCHYGEQHGDPMRDPEVVFLVEGSGAGPVYFRNDYAGVEYATVPGHFGNVSVRPQLQRQLNDFVRGWWSNLKEQGFFQMAKSLPEREKTQESTPAVASPMSEANDPVKDPEPEEPLKRYRFRVMQTVDLWGEATVDAHNQEEAEEQALEHFEPDWGNSSTVDFTSELLDVEDIPTPVPADRVSVQLKDENHQSARTRAHPEAEVCSLDLGRFAAVVHAPWNAVSETHTYSAEVLGDGRAVLSPLQKHELAGVERILGDRGLVWFTDRLREQELPEPSQKDFQDFQEVVRGAEALIGRFIERGHREVLQEVVLPNTKLGDALGVEVGADPAQNDEHGYER